MWCQRNPELFKDPLHGKREAKVMDEKSPLQILGVKKHIPVFWFWSSFDMPLLLN